MTLVEFFEKVDRSGGSDACWPWRGTRQSGGGYGMAGNEYAHRVALEIALGRPLARAEWSLHHCDNPPCVNPRHLFVGNVTANNRDMIEKGRHRRARSWACPDCGDQVSAVVRKAGARCDACRAVATKAKRRRAYEAWRSIRPLKDPDWRSRRRERCIRGHEMSGANIYASPSGRRMCRACIDLRGSCQRRTDPLTLGEVAS